MSYVWYFTKYVILQKETHQCTHMYIACTKKNKNTFSNCIILLTVIIVKKIRTYIDTLHVVTLNYSFFFNI